MPKLSDAAQHRSRTISFRTSEQTEYAIGLIARKHGLTKTAVLQFALRHFLRDPNEGLSLPDGTKASFEQIVRETWAPDPDARLARLAARYPELLDDENLAAAQTGARGGNAARSAAPGKPV